MIFDKAIKNMSVAPNIEPANMSFQNPDEWLKGITSGTTQTGAMKLSAVNACVEIITNSISKIPIYVMDRKTKKRVEHPLVKVLCERPNEAMTPSVYKKLVQANILLKGNGYALIIRDKKTANPVELIPMSSDYITPWFDGKGKLWYVFTNPITRELRKLDNFDVLHYKSYSEDGVHGISVLSRASETINTAKAAQTYENKFYTQNAQPTGILKTEGDLDKTAKDKIRDEWNKIHKGADNAFRIAVLDLGISYQPISISNKDAQFIESKNITVEDISRFFVVPLYKINAGKESYNANEQNSIEYLVNTVHPYITQYEEEDTYKLLFDGERASGLEIRRNMMAELKGDAKSRGEWYKSMREIGVFSSNDIQDLEDRPDVPGGDTRYASLNYVPLEDFANLSKKRNEVKNK